MKEADDAAKGNKLTIVMSLPVVSLDAPLSTVEGEMYEIPPEGSLGLLAMGYTGIMLWRDKKYKHLNNPKIL